MDFQLNQDQTALVSAVADLLRDHLDLPQAEKLSYSFFDATLQAKLLDYGFLDAGRELGPLEAALVAMEVARAPVVAEAAASALVAPKVLGPERLAGPFVLLRAGELGKAHRNLPIARLALVDLGEDVAVLDIEPGQVEAVESVLAYPYGRFRTGQDLARARRIPTAGEALRQWWRVALAVEIAGAALSAVDFTVEYVKGRKVFGRAVGAFQTVRHRLVHCRQAAAGAQYLALRAAWSGEAQDADIAACFAQANVHRLVFDLHQFNGAMGMTNEHLLHFWTFRLRALQAEAGGVQGAALDIAQGRWGSGTAAAAATSMAPASAAAGKAA